MRSALTNGREGKRCDAGKVWCGCILRTTQKYPMILTYCTLNITNLILFLFLFRIVLCHFPTNGQYSACGHWNIIPPLRKLQVGKLQSPPIRPTASSILPLLPLSQAKNKYRCSWIDILNVHVFVMWDIDLNPHLSHTLPVFFSTHWSATPRPMNVVISHSPCILFPLTDPPPPRPIKEDKHFWILKYVLKL